MVKWIVLMCRKVTVCLKEDKCGRTEESDKVMGGRIEVG